MDPPRSNPLGSRVIIVVDRTGENAYAVADGYGPLWSSDVETLLFCRTASLWVMNADGTTRKKAIGR